MQIMKGHQFIVMARIIRDIDLCPFCDGEGHIEVFDRSQKDRFTEVCPACLGEGLLPKVYKNNSSISSRREKS